MAEVGYPDIAVEPCSILCLLVVCFFGGYAIANRSFDVKAMVVMGIVAYLLNLLELPTVPMCWG